MTILLDARLNVNEAEVEPTELDRRYAAETSPYRDVFQADDDEPIEVLEDTTDHGDEADEDLGDWWNWMGPDADLDARWSATIAGGAGSVASARWAAEGRDPVRSRSTHGDLYGRDTAGSIL